MLPLFLAVEGRTPLHAASSPTFLQRKPRWRDPSGWPEGRRPPASRRGGDSEGGELVETTPLPPSSSRPIMVGLPSGAPHAFPSAAVLSRLHYPPWDPLVRVPQVSCRLEPLLGSQCRIVEGGTRHRVPWGSANAFPLNYQLTTWDGEGEARAPPLFSRGGEDSSLRCALPHLPPARTALEGSKRLAEGRRPFGQPLGRRQWGRSGGGNHPSSPVTTLKF
ncbi:hypothetical protein Sjap_004375 [Stephania japonica]|uniref:Uncharacterized protein n=1 Tax=Stephania japonica TaxID=461633 RepID=A0AAP0PHS6_9MAGN